MKTFTQDASYYSSIPSLYHGLQDPLQKDFNSQKHLENIGKKKSTRLHRYAKNN